MSKIKRIKNKDYTVISNVFLRDKELSLKAKGVLAVIMGLPDDWDFSINGLCAISMESQTSIRSIIEELRNKGYCRYEEVRNEGRICKPNYIFDEKPSFDKEFSKRQLNWDIRKEQLEEMVPDILKSYESRPHTESTHTVKSYMENVLQLSTKDIKYLLKLINNNKDIDKSISTECDDASVLIESKLTAESIKEEQFEKFWDIYDKKVGKIKAKSLFMKLKTEDIEAMAKVIRQYVSSKPDKQYRPHPENFLRNKMWQDEIISKTGKSKPKIDDTKVALADGTFTIGGYRYYMSRDNGRVSILPQAPDRPNDGQNWDYNLHKNEWYINE